MFKLLLWLGELMAVNWLLLCEELTGSPMSHSDSGVESG